MFLFFSRVLKHFFYLFLGFLSICICLFFLGFLSLFLFFLGFLSIFLFFSRVLKHFFIFF